MGILKVVILITAPVVGLTVAAFRLKKDLPIASRLFGNYIGLGYVYFKSIITYIKPVDHLPFEMISLARKTSQQSQALKRELNSTLKRVREDLNTKKQETFKKFQTEADLSHFREDFLNDKTDSLSTNEQKLPSSTLSEQSGSILILNVLKNRNLLLSLKQEKKKSRKFFDQL